MSQNRYTDVHYNEDLRPYTDYARKFCQHLADNYFGRRDGKFLDICCGRGEHLEHFKNIGFDVYGIDRDSIARDKGFEVAIRNVDSDKFPYPDTHFEAIMVKSAIEHIRNTDNLMSEIYRVLKPGAKVVITTCDWKKLYKRFYDDYTHKTPFTKTSMEDMFKIFKFSKFKVEHFYHLPFTWKGDFYKSIAWLLSYVPLEYTQTDRLTEFDKLIRFSQEVQLLGFAEK